MSSSSIQSSPPSEQTGLLEASSIPDPEAAGSQDATEPVSEEGTIGLLGTTKTDIDSHRQTKSVSAIISLLLVGVFVANAEGSLILASYGRISSDFGDLHHANWLITGYTLAMSVAQPVYGKVSDICGRSHVLVVAYGIFAFGCGISALGQSLKAVVVGRIVSGVGGAGMSLLVSIIITDLVPLRDVAVWRSYVGIVATAGRASGGPLGGWLTDTVGWRWSFAGQCPPLVVSIILVWLFVPNTKVNAANHSLLEQLLRVDFGGILLVGSTILFFLLPFELAGTVLPWNHPFIYASFGGAALLASMFLLFEKRWAKEPIMPMHILTSKDFIISNVIVFGQIAAQLGMMSTVPLFFQITQGTSATIAGAHLLPAVLGVTIAGLFGGHMTKRYGRYKWLLIGGSISACLCYLLLMLRWSENMGSWEALYIVPGGFGNGLVLSMAFVALTSKTSHEDMSATCTAYYLTGNIGCSAGMATSGAVLQSILRVGLRKSLEGNADADEIIQRVTSNIDEVSRLSRSLKSLVISSYVNGFKYTYGLDLVFGILALFAGFLVKENRL